jgi:hypothetical protein
MERGQVGDEMVRSHHQQDRVSRLRGEKGGDGQRRRRVSARRLQHDASVPLADRLQLVGDDEAVFRVGDQQRGVYLGRLAEVFQA